MVHFTFGVRLGSRNEIANAMRNELSVKLRFLIVNFIHIVVNYFQFALILNQFFIKIEARATKTPCLIFISSARHPR